MNMGIKIDRIFLFTILFFLPFIGFCQEFKATVIVNDQQIASKNAQFTSEMQKAITQLIQNTIWTEDKFKDFEKIKMSIQITLKAPSDFTTGKFSANVQVQTSRPVYNSDFETPLLVFFDNDASFSYLTSDQIQYTDGLYSSSLTSLISFYCYVALGYDYDSFSLLGGTAHFEKAKEIFNLTSQSGGGSGWSNSSDRKGKAQLIQNLVDPQHTDGREALYLYHLKGLDLYSSDLPKGRESIEESIRKLNEVYKNNPSSLFLRAFFDAKALELINAIKKSDLEYRLEFSGMLKRMDPTNAAKYQTLEN